MMLQGQIPSRALLADFPIYLSLATAIMRGNVVEFTALSQHPQFAEDGLMSLVQRLRSAVILAGLALLAQVYSRISFADIAEILHMGSSEDAEGFCAKAASEGTIQAEIDHTAQCLVAVSREGDTGDTLSERIHRDIKDCFAVREDAQRATHKEKVVED
jgi:hypothetical protein